jgi:hypothetical protein
MADLRRSPREDGGWPADSQSQCCPSRLSESPFISESPFTSESIRQRLSRPPVCRATRKMHGPRRHLSPPEKEEARNPPLSLPERGSSEVRHREWGGVGACSPARDGGGGPIARDAMIFRGSVLRKRRTPCSGWMPCSGCSWVGFRATGAGTLGGRRAVMEPPRLSATEMTVGEAEML